MNKIKGYIPKRIIPPTPSLSGSIDSVLKTVEDLNATKKNVVETLDSKVKEVDLHIGNAETLLDQKIKDVDSTIQKAESDIKGAVDYVKEIKQGEAGKDAQPVDTEQIIKDVLAQIPPVPEVIPLDESNIL